MSFVNDFVNNFTNTLTQVFDGLMLYTPDVTIPGNLAPTGTRSDFIGALEGLRNTHNNYLPSKETGATKTPPAIRPHKSYVAGTYNPSQITVGMYDPSYQTSLLKLDSMIRNSQANILNHIDRTTQATQNHANVNTNLILERVHDNARIMETLVTQTNENLLSGLTQSNAFLAATINNAVSRVQSNSGLSYNQMSGMLNNLEYRLGNVIAFHNKGDNVDYSRKFDNIANNIGWLKNEVHKLHTQLPGTLVQEYALYLRQGLIDESANVDLSSGMGFVTSLAETLEDIFGGEGDTPDGIERLQKLIQITRDIGDGKYSNIDDVINDLQDIIFGFSFLSDIFGASIAAFAAIKGYNSLSSAYAQNITYLANNLAENYRFTPEQSLALFLRQGIDDDFIENELKQYGFNQNRIEMFKKLRLSLMNEGEIRELYLRGEISEEKRDSLLERIGIVGFTAHDKMQLWYPIPPLDDLIRMAVRDVFSPEIVQEFGLDEDFPDEFATFAAQHGLTDEWAKRYWYGHWSLPSITQGYEMYHRGIINIEQLKILMKGLDIAPTWRDNLIKMSHNPITRVDVRRMHAMGFIDYDELVKRYKDIGYTDDDAKLMSDWTVAYNERSSLTDNSGNKEITQGALLRLYGSGILNRTETYDKLVDYGYSETDSNNLLTLYEMDNIQNSDGLTIRDNVRRIEREISKAYIKGYIDSDYVIETFTKIGYSFEDIQSEINYLNWEREIAEITILIDNIRERFDKHIIDKNDVMSLLTSIGIKSNESSMMINNWSIIRENKVRLPTKTDIEKFAKANIININEYYDLMRGIGYDDNIITMYAKEMGLIPI